MFTINVRIYEHTSIIINMIHYPTNIDWFSRKTTDLRKIMKITKFGIINYSIIIPNPRRSTDGLGLAGSGCLTGAGLASDLASCRLGEASKLEG